MDDATNTAVKSRTVEAKTIVKQGSLGHPMSVLHDETINKAIMGRVIGIATGVSSSTVEDRETGEEKKLKSLVGSFRAIPADASKPIVTSAKCGLPIHVMQPVIDILEANKGTGLIVEVVFDMGVERAKNAAGYSWYGVPLMTPTDDDPVMRLAARFDPAATKALEHSAGGKGSRNQR